MIFLDIFSNTFMVNALVVGIFTAISTAILGNFIVAARQTMASGMLAHTALVGVGLGIFFNTDPGIFVFFTTIIFSLLLWWGSKKTDQAPEALSMMFISVGLATTLLLVHLNKDNPVSLDTYLFGSILTINNTEMYVFILLNIFISSILLVFWYPLLTLVFDKTFSQIKKYNTFYEILFMFLIALVVGIGLKIIGGLLIGGLLVIPVLAAKIFSTSFKNNVIMSIIINIFGVFIGIISSFYLDIPASSGIILSLLLIFIFLYVFHIFKTMLS